MQMASDPDDSVIVRCTIDLARNLGLSVVAEGVEDRETRELLAQLGCHRIQGYHVSRPRIGHEIPALLAELDTEPSQVPLNGRAPAMAAAHTAPKRLHLVG